MKRKKIKVKKNNLQRIFFTVIVCFFISLTVLIVVNTMNNIKRGQYIGQDIEEKNTISVSATGKVFAKPDLALVIFSVLTEKETVSEVMEENTEKMNSVVNVIKEQGVEEKDLKTTAFNIYPVYEYNNEDASPRGKKVLVGYEITQSLQVKIRDMTKIGDIIQKATEAGVNKMSSLEFTIDQQDKFKKQAREKAIEEAKEKAEELASQLNVTLLKITDFQESNIYPRFYEIAKPAIIDEMGGAEIEAGENLIETTVFITYAIR